jgi:predicted membrane protein
MMLDIFISVILIVIFFYPVILQSMNTPIGNPILLFCIFMVTRQNLILGFVAGLLFMYHYKQMSEQFSPKSKHKYKHSLLPLDEIIRPKESNKYKVSRPQQSASTKEISGSIQVPVSNNNTGEYTQFNL